MLISVGLVSKMENKDEVVGEVFEKIGFGWYNKWVFLVCGLVSFT